MSELPTSVRDAFARIRVLTLDVDGVLTDGRLYYSADGESLKGFHVHDGLGLRLLQEQDIKVAVISARDSAALARRVQDLGIGEHFYPGSKNKLSALEHLLNRLTLPPEVVAHVGDDLPDVPVMRRVLLPIAVGNAHRFTRAEARHVTAAAGGQGAIREVADTLLRAQGRYQSAYEASLARHLQ